MRAMELGFAVIVVLASGSARADIDCAQCKAVCGKSDKARYPDDAKPEQLAQQVKHKSPEAQRLFEAGRVLDPGFGGKDAKGAAQNYKSAILLDPDNSQYRNFLAAVLLSMGQIDEAIYNLAFAVRMTPAEPKYVVNLGYAYHKSGDEVRALVHYMRGLNLDPRDLRARLYAGYALELLGQRDEAALELKRVLVQDPQNPKALAALSRMGVRLDSAPEPKPIP